MNPVLQNKSFQRSVFLCIISIILSDQLAKFFFLSNFTPGESLPIVKSIFHFTLVLNKGGAFGIFTPHHNGAGFLNATPIFIAISVVVILFILILLFKKRLEYNIKIALACICAGAISNLIDRLRFGYVVDFFDFRIWPVFNIADTAITLGTLWLLYTVIARREARAKCSEASPKGTKQSPR